MPIESPLKIGDEPYPQYSVTTSEYIKQSVAITKGYIYTKDSNGRLIVPVSTTSVADLTKGIYQAKSDASAPSAEDTDRVQCLNSRSRILIKADANLVVGQDVDLKSASTTTTQDKVMAGVHPHTKGHLGKIFEIYTKGTDGAIKQKTADNDLVVVDVEAA